MRFFVVLLIVVVLVQGGITKKDHEDSSHSSGAKSKGLRHIKHERSKLLHKVVKEASGATNNSKIDYRLSEFQLSASESVYLNYNETTSAYGIWNYKKNLSLLYANKDELMGVYNSSSQSLLVINTSSNEVTISVNVTLEFTKDNLPKSFSAMYELMINKTPGGLSVSVRVFLNAVINMEDSSNCGNCDFVKCLTGSFDKYVEELRKGIIDFGDGILNTIGDNVSAIGANISNIINEFNNGIRVGVKNSIKGFGILLTPLFSTARQVGLVFGIFFDNVIRNGVSLQKILIQFFSRAIGSGARFINVDLFGNLNIALNLAGTFFNNITEALAQTFLYGGIKKFVNGTINEGGKNESVTSVITGENDWLIRIGGKLDLKMTVNYNSKYNLFAFYNRVLNITTVFSGNTGFYSVFNTTSGVGLIVSQLTGNAKLVIDKTGRIHDAFIGHKDFKSGFILIGKIIEKQSGGLNNLINLDSNVFSLRTVVFLLKSGLNVDLAFLGKGTILKTVNLNFNILFNSASEFFKRNDINFDLSLGPLNILFPVLNFTALTNNFIPIIRDIFSNLEGRFNPSLIIRMGFIFSENLITGINNFVFGALNFALNTIKNFTGGISNAIKSVLANLPSANIEINIKPGGNGGGNNNCSCPST